MLQIEGSGVWEVSTVAKGNSAFSQSWYVHINSDPFQQILRSTWRIFPGEIYSHHNPTSYGEKSALSKQQTPLSFNQITMGGTCTFRKRTGETSTYILTSSQCLDAWFLSSLVIHLTPLYPYCLPFHRETKPGRYISIRSGESPGLVWLGAACQLLLFADLGCCGLLSLL